MLPIGTEVKAICDPCLISNLCDCYNAVGAIEKIREKHTYGRELKRPIQVKFDKGRCVFSDEELIPLCEQEEIE